MGCHAVWRPGATVPAKRRSRSTATSYPTIVAGLHFVRKPVQRMIVNLEYAQGSGDNRGVYLKLGYAW